MYMYNTPKLNNALRKGIGWKQQMGEAIQESI